MTSSEERRRINFQGFPETVFKSSICGLHVNQTEILISVPQVKAGTVPYMQGSFVLGTLSFPEYVVCSRKSLKPNVETVKHFK